MMLIYFDREQTEYQRLYLIGGVQDVVPEDFVSSSKGFGCGLSEQEVHEQSRMRKLTKRD